MIRRKLLRAEAETSLLGFGCMRFPLNEDGEVDEDRAVKLLRRGIDGGIGYVDTAYGYHGGKSEVIVGRALRDGYRERVLLTTKLPGRKAETHDDFEALFSEQLDRLGVGSVDFYLVHSLYEELWEKLLALDLFGFLDRIRKDGRARQIGFSFHDEYDVFARILGAYDWDVCQIQYNIVDEQYQAGKRGLELARNAGVDVIVMEPLRGGALVKQIPADVAACWQRSDRRWSPVEWAFRFAASDPGVKVILSGMSDEQQVDDNLNIFADDFEPFNENDRETIRCVQARYAARIKVACTGCEYCLPCPQDVAIPRIFALYNDKFMFDDAEAAERSYETLSGEGRDQSNCVACAICESLCPQHIAVIEKLKEADDSLKTR